MPRIEQVLESSLYVSDVARAVAFYRDILGLRLMSEFARGRGAAFAAGQTVLLLFRAEETLKEGKLPSHGAHGPGHVAFRVEASEVESWRRHLHAHGVAIEREHRFGDNPPSLFFRDPDGNLLEMAVASIWPFKSSTGRRS